MINERCSIREGEVADVKIMIINYEAEKILRKDSLFPDEHLNPADFVGWLRLLPWKQGCCSGKDLLKMESAVHVEAAHP